MNKSKTLLLTISTICILIGSILLFFQFRDLNYRRASADSGFDSSWDSGGDWDSGSSWDSDSSWDSGSSRNSSSGTFGDGEFSVAEAVFVFFFFGFILFLIIIAVAISVKDSKNHTNSLRTIPKPPEISDAEKALLEKYGYSKDKVLEEAYKVYVRVQEAWSINDIDQARDCLGDELYNQYKAQLMGLIAKHQRNVMSDFEFVSGYIISVREVVDSIVIAVMLSVKCKDYLATEEVGTVLRGDANKINHYTYALGFLVSSKEVELKNCPNCNAEITATGSSVTCGFCGANISRKTNTLVLKEKKMLQQY